MAGYAAERRSLIVEGVHLNVELMMSLLAQHTCCVPVLVHISNEAKHRQRFAVRAKYMALNSDSNRYFAHYDAIRTIQRHLVKHADSCLLPKVDNTNVDRSLAAVHVALLHCLARTAAGASLYDPVRHQVLEVNQAFVRRSGWSSKAMLQVIQAKVEKREPQAEQ